MQTSELPTFVYIDASNIRNACEKSCGFRIDFHRLYAYLQKKYPALGAVKYFEGVELGDLEKHACLETLKKTGYQTFVLERKCYENPPIFKTFSCEECGHKQKIMALRSTMRLKSNIDVYLATEFLADAARVKETHHFILFSCDGDYAEMIRKVRATQPHIRCSVVATPMKKTNNYLSSRLKELKTLEGYDLVNIESVKDLIGGNGKK